jgi:FkbM family methyltransferase
MIDRAILILRYFDAYVKCLRLGKLNRLRQRKINVLRYLLHEIEYFKSKKFDLVLDVGSNTGEFAAIYLELYPNAEVKCFEPIPFLAKNLKHKFKFDFNVEVIECALSDSNGQADLQITRNIASSSLLKPNSANILSDNGADVIEVISVQRRKLDDIFAKKDLKNKKILCKIDVQGAELSVLKGAHSILSNVDTLVLECGFLPLYSGEASFNDVYQFLHSHSFDIVGVLKQSGRLNNGFSRNLDIVFQRRI